MEANKGYNTKQKMLILDLLKENKNRHMSVEDMLPYLNNVVSKATLYRHLDTLVANGVVRKFVIDENIGSCFQYVEDDNCHNHFHLKCVECGELIHLECEQMQEVIKHIEKEHEFEVDISKVIVYGVCKCCQERIINNKEVNHEK